MLPMRYLRTHVFSKQEKEFVETAMAFARQFNIEFHIFLNTPTSIPSESHRTIRRILSRSTGTKCRNLLLPAATATTTTMPTRKLFEELRVRKRRRKFASLYDNVCVKKLLYKYFINKQYRSNRSTPISPVSCFNRQTKRSSIRCLVPSNRKRRVCDIGSTKPKQQQFPSPGPSPTTNTNGLCTSAAYYNTRRRTASNSLSHLAMGRLAKSGRYQKNSIMSQRTRSNLRMLQSSSLESAIQDR